MPDHRILRDLPDAEIKRALAETATCREAAQRLAVSYRALRGRLGSKRRLGPWWARLRARRHARRNAGRVARWRARQMLREAREVQRAVGAGRPLPPAWQRRVIRARAILAKPLE